MTQKRFWAGTETRATQQPALAREHNTPWLFPLHQAVLTSPVHPQPNSLALHRSTLSSCWLLTFEISEIIYIKKRRKADAPPSPSQIFSTPPRKTPLLLYVWILCPSSNLIQPPPLPHNGPAQEAGHQNSLLLDHCNTVGGHYQYRRDSCLWPAPSLQDWEPEGWRGHTLLVFSLQVLAVVCALNPVSM